MLSNPLIMLIAVPILAGVFCLILPDRARMVTKVLSFSVTLAGLAGSIFVFINKPLYWQVSDYRVFICDDLSGLIGLGIGLFGFLLAIYSSGFIEKAFGRYFGYYLITLGSSFGAAFANDLIALILFWGMLAMTLYLLINLQGTDEASAAAKKTSIIIGGTDAVMLLGIGIIWVTAGTFDMAKIRLEMNGGLPFIAYLSILVGALAKAGAMPLHSWLPDAAQTAPTPVTAYLPASLDKLLGIYLLARLSLNMFVMNSISNTILLAVGSLTIVLAVIFALVQHDLKRLLGYHAVSQVGYMIVGIGTGNPIGIAGGLFHMLNNAVYKSCLFLAGGSVEKRTGTTDLTRLGGLSKCMPLTFASFLVASLSISGIPPFNGFVSKWMIYQGIIESAGAKNPAWVVWLVAAMFGSGLTIASFMKLLHAVFLGRPSKGMAHIKEAPFSLVFPPVILALICVVLGVFAFLVPLPLFILPAVGRPVIYLGQWSPIAAFGLMALAIILGFTAYLVLRQGRFRSGSAPFIGGEEVSSLERVSGAEFYDTVRELKWLKGLYRKEEEKRLDIYEEGSKATFLFSKGLQWLHNGILPTYLVWCLLGMLVLFISLVR